MTWFRAGSSVAKLAIRKTLSQTGSYTSRTRILPSGTRQFHSTVSKSKAQSAPVPHAVPLSRLTDSFLDGTSSVYLEELQRAWEADPNSVDESWDNFFKNFVGQAATSPGISGQTIQESMRLLLLVRAYQVYGHMKANLDPLGLEQREIPDDLDPALYGFSEADLDREFFLGVWRMSGFLSENRPVQTLRSILTRLEQAYCGSIGFEYMHIADREQCNWLRDRIETPTKTAYNSQRREVILDRLIWSTQFENFLATKWTAAKRFGLEGGETLIPGMKEMFDRSADLGVESIVIGMSHRGRLNVLGNVVRKPLRQIFSEFTGGIRPIEEVGLYTGTGDVKYHLGTSYDRPTRGGKRIHLSLVANPSHLEAVDPVVVGKTRAKQYYSNDVDRTKNLSILIHGDGSFAGQGVVYETLHLSALPNYTTGGTIHIVVNNQVAFTTDPKSGRSSQYCTDVAKALNAPIFHVNGDDVEAVVHAFELAAEWRQTFHSDVVVDIICYRRFGHNEIDEPSFTQPKMYKVIKNHPSALEIYQKKLLETGQATKEDIDRIQNKVTSILNEEFLASKDFITSKRDWLSAYWTGFKSPEQLSRIRNTGVKPEILKNVGKAIATLPETFKPHRAVKKIFADRLKMIETGEGVDWAVGEALAFATLLVEGNHVRLSGQDVERGTFSHRHSVLHDQETGERYCPLANVVINQHEEMFTVSNSSLSEFGVLGFELGYSMENPNSLVIWEAQFGDFSNGAQVIFDQFLSSGEAKWLRQIGLVVLLPHGYDGQGPEHSSCRLERFLQMSDDNPYVIPEMEPTQRNQIQTCNWQVVNVTTPANYFHVLRRQIHREFRKPLIVMAPKNLLRHKDCKSNLSEFDDVQGHPGFDKQGTRFKRLIKDQSGHSDLEEGIRRLVLCSGKLGDRIQFPTFYIGVTKKRKCAIGKEKVATEPSTSQLQAEMRQEQAELEHLRREVSRLRTENARLTSSNLNAATVQELHQLEQQLNDGLISVKEKKDAMLFEEIDRSNHKERELGFENNVLRGEIERLKCFIPQSEQPTQPGFLEYNPVADVPSSSAGLLKQDRLSPDTVCYYGSDNTDLETALQLRGYVGIHSSGFRDFLLKPELLRLSYCVLFSSLYSVSAINLEGQSLDKFLEHYIANNSWVVEKGQAKGQLISLPANEFNHPELKRTQELFRSYRLQEPLDDYCR